MSDCPTAEDLVRWVDGALSVERTERLEGHLRACVRCREEAAALRTLVSDLRAPLPSPLNVAAHTQAVMARLERPAAVIRPRSRWLGGAAAAAALLLLVGATRSSAPFFGEAGQPRGGASVRSVARDVRLRPCQVKDGLRFLSPGATIDDGAALTATFRNLGPTAYLLLFAVDSERHVHWIAPRFERAGEDPLAEALSSTAHETILDTTAVLEDLTPGPLRIVAVLSAAPARVSEIDSMDGTEIDRARLEQRLSAGVDIRETLVQVTRASAPNGGDR